MQPIMYAIEFRQGNTERRVAVKSLQDAEKVAAKYKKLMPDVSITIKQLAWGV